MQYFLLKTAELKSELGYKKKQLFSWNSTRFVFHLLRFSIQELQALREVVLNLHQL